MRGFLYICQDKPVTSTSSLSLVWFDLQYRQDDYYQHQRSRESKMSIISFCETSSQVQTPRNLKRKFDFFEDTTENHGIPCHCPKRPRPEPVPQPRPRPRPQQQLHSPDIKKLFKNNLNVPSTVNDIDSSIADMEEDSLSPSFSDFDDTSQPYSTELATANFWDGLSKVWLTTRALEEFSRRTIHVQMPDPVNENLNEIVPVESIDSKALKRYARQGGPDLRDLRRVSVINRANCASDYI